jgi:N-acetylglutamate synthase-like GNAT family acetyltransferase/SAM-dependent methyltransferase
MTTPTDASTGTDDVTTVVRERYGAAARRVLAASDDANAGCCGPVNACCGGAEFGGTVDPITANLYVHGETDQLPSAAVLASLGCGNPTALAELRAGEVVLDLGSGGGIDVLLSARRVGPTGKAYGLDMTDDMLALARRNAAEAGIANVEFIRGNIEAIPLPDASVDVIISNCVVNLAADKRRVLAEAFRVLRPGGRFAVSDVVVRGTVPDEVRASMALWIGCVAGALEEGEFRTLLGEVGFVDAEVEPTRIYRGDDARAVLAGAGLDADALAPRIDGKIMAAFVRATKPAPDAAACCGPTCCAPAPTHAGITASRRARAPLAPVLRAATTDDLPGILALLTASRLPVDGVAAIVEHDASAFTVAHDPADRATLVATGGLEIAGHDALVRSVAVASPYRGRGVGDAIVARLVDDATRRGLDACWLLTTTAAPFFAARGFNEATRAAVPAPLAATVEFTSACPASATVMTRALHGRTARDDARRDA